VLFRRYSSELYAVRDWWYVHWWSLCHYFRTHLSILVIESLLSTSMCHFLICRLLKSLPFFMLPICEGPSAHLVINNATKVVLPTQKAEWSSLVIPVYSIWSIHVKNFELKKTLKTWKKWQGWKRLWRLNNKTLSVMFAVWSLHPGLLMFTKKKWRKVFVDFVYH